LNKDLDIFFRVVFFGF